MNAAISDSLKKHCSVYSEKSRSIVSGRMDLIYELRTKRGIELTNQLSSLDGIYSVSLLKHDGEVTF